MSEVLLFLIHAYVNQTLLLFESWNMYNAKSVKWICGLNEYKISIASIKLLPICYQLICSDLVFLCNILQNNYNIKVYELKNDELTLKN